MTTVWIFRGSTEPSAFCRYSIVTCVLPSGRSHHSDPSLRTSVSFLPRRVASRIVSRHRILRLIRGVAEHDALVASADVHLVLPDVHATSNVGALLVDRNLHVRGVAAQALALHGREVFLEDVVPDPLAGLANDLVVVQRGLRGDLAEHHHHVVLAARLARHLAVRVDLKACVEDSIRDLVSELVRVTLVHGLRRKEEGALSLGLLRRGRGHLCCTR